MHAKLRTVILVLTGVLIVGGLLYVSFREDPVPVDLHIVSRGEVQITVDADGKTRIRDIFEVAAPIAGTARRSPVRAGDTVVAGETVVAIVEPVAAGLLDARTRRQAEASLSEAKAALHVAEADLQKAEEDQALAQSQFNRIKALAERKVVSLTQLEDATQRLAVSAAGVEAARARVDMSQSILDRAQATLMQPEIGSSVSDSCCVQIRAPADGVVLSVVTVSEHPVLPGSLLVTIGDPDDLEVVVDLLSSDAVRIAPGARASIERTGNAAPLEAVLDRIDPVAVTKVSALGIEEQRVDAYFTLNTPVSERAALGEGFSVFARIVEWETDDALRIPISALFRRGDAWATYVVEGGRAVERRITLGHRNWQVAEVLSGLTQGETVILHPSDKIAAGTLIAER